MKAREKKIEYREQRDLLTVVRCMLCLIPETQVALRESLEDISGELSFPNTAELLPLNKKLSQILTGYYDKYKDCNWMRAVISIYLNKTYDDILESLGVKEPNLINVEQVKAQCDKGNLTASILVSEEDENTVYLTLDDNLTGKRVVLNTMTYVGQ